MSHIVQFEEEILSMIRESNLTFPGLDEATILGKILPIAQEWCMMRVVELHLDQENQEVFRDCAMTDPVGFDAFEFLDSTIDQVEEKIEAAFFEWKTQFLQQLP